MNFIDSNYVTGSCTSDSFVRNSENKGNYTGSIAVTGSSDAYAQKNIYDLAGNVSEWAMEAYNTDCRIFKGGNFYHVGANGPASFRSSYNPDYTNSSVGLRVTLYI